MNKALQKYILSLLVALWAVVMSTFLYAPPAATADEGLGLTIKSDALSEEAYLSYEQLLQLPGNTYDYTAYNTFPTYQTSLSGSGPQIIDILLAAGVDLEPLQSITFISSDGFKIKFTAEELIHQTRYFFPNGREGSKDGDNRGDTEGQVPVQAIINLEYPGGRLMFGQVAPNEQNFSVFAKNILGGTIIVSNQPAEQLEPVIPTVNSGTVSAGEKIILKHPNSAAKIYYTTDDSSPDQFSILFNKSTGYQPELNTPINIHGNDGDTVTIKARAYYYGLLPSEEQVFTYRIAESSPQALRIRGNGIVPDADLTLADLHTIGNSAVEYKVDNRILNVVGFDLASYLSSEGIINPAANVKFYNVDDRVLESVDFQTMEEQQYFLAYKINSEAINYSDNKQMKYYFAILRNSNAGLDAANQIEYVRTIEIESPAAPTDDEAYLTIESPESDNKFVPGARISVAGSAKNTNTITLSIKDESGTLCYMLQKPVCEQSYKFNLCLPKELGKYTVCLGASGLAKPLTRTIEVSSDGTDPGEENEPNEDTILIITGPGVNNTLNYSWQDLEQFASKEQIYSVINNYPTSRFYNTVGISLHDILETAGLKANASYLTVESKDGYSCDFTIDELFQAPRYYYPGLKENSIEGKVFSEAALAYEWSEGQNANNLPAPHAYKQLLFAVGQRNITEQNHPWFVEQVWKITVKTDDPGQWAVPSVNKTPGAVAKGTLVTLQHDQLDKIKLYYTSNGENPSIDSSMYNISKSYLNPDLNKPISIDQDMIIRAIAVGPGKADSEQASFSYSIAASPTPNPGGGGGGPSKPSVVIEPPKIPTVSQSDRNHFDYFFTDQEINTLIARNRNDKLDSLTIKTSSENQLVGGQMHLSNAAWSSIAESGFDEVFFDFGIGRIVLNKEQITMQAAKASALINLEFIELNPEEIEKNADKIARIREYRVDIADGELGSSVIKGPIQIQINYSLGELQTPETIIALQSSATDLSIIKNSRYDSRQGRLIFFASNLGNLALAENQVQFTDVTNHWSQESIIALASRQIISGYPGGNFYPEQQITRAEFTAMIYRALDYPEVNPSTSSFIDVNKDAWYYTAVSWAAAQGLVQGQDSDRFNPNAFITREEMAQLIYKFISSEQEIVKSIGNKAQLLDEEDISPWAKEAFSALYQASIISGSSEQKALPKGNATRAEAAQLLWQAINYINQAY